MELPDSTGFHLEYKFPFFSSGGLLQNFLGSLRKSTIGKEENLFFYLGSRFVLGIPFLLSGMTEPRGASVSRFPRRFFQLCRPLAGPPSRAKWIIDGTKQWRSFVPRAWNVICSIQGLSVLCSSSGLSRASECSFSSPSLSSAFEPRVKWACGTSGCPIRVFIKNHAKSPRSSRIFHAEEEVERFLFESIESREKEAAKHSRRSR